jgi:hypothetical protein
MSELVKKLATGRHPIVLSLAKAKSLDELKDRIQNGYLHVRFTDTRGETELGVSLDPNRCCFEGANLDAGTGSITLVGSLQLDYVDVECVAEIDLSSFSGTGHLQLLSKNPASGLDNSSAPNPAGEKAIQ